MKNKVNVAIVGVSGYTGLELVKMLMNHDVFNISYLANTSGETKINKIHPCLNGICDLEVHKVNINDIKDTSSLVFLALPHKASMAYAKDLLIMGLKVVDLSADYRLKIDTYEKYYCEHEDKNNLQNAVYGLPEFYKDEIKNANLVANPGCYPTASILAIMPFMEYLNENQSIFIDAKSGLTGAGIKLNNMTTFVNINENMFAYNVLKHRHSPEIVEKISLVGKKNLKINFVPHLIPVSRGMLVSVYATLNANIDAKNVLKNYYKNEKFIRISDIPVSIKNTTGTNFCDIFVEQNGNDIFVSSSIDNLLKGASSAALVNANLMFDLPEDMGVPVIAHAN